ncbi:MAG: hypothetical protein EA364_01325 [Balneolaceae bacterium]|nr:MAG: hypothetical protein EA364_01325 [Balneolaceae bacterium]
MELRTKWGAGKRQKAKGKSREQKAESKRRRKGGEKAAKRQKAKGRSDSERSGDTWWVLGLCNGVKSDYVVL